LAAVHFEHARWRPKPDDQRINVLPDVFLSKPRNNFLFGRGATTQHGAKRHNPQETH
jgi:hypothetical protein